MAVNPSIQLGTSGNWAIKEDNLLAYKQLGNKFFDREFDFSRGTTATFVGRNGLIQESGLIDTELVTNGDFATDSDWTKTNATISNGLATITVTNGGYSALNQSITYAAGKKYIITAQIQGLSGSSGKQIKFQDRGDNTGGLNVSNGLITLNETLQNIEISWTANSNSNIIVITRQSNGGDYSFTIDNVSIKEIQTDVPRIDFTDDPTGHLLLEPQSTNILAYSQDFSQNYWGIQSATVTTSTITDPTGDQNSFKLVPNSGTGGNRSIGKNFLSLSGLHTQSVFAKKGEYNYIALRTRNSPNASVMFDLENGTFNVNSTSVAFVSAKIEDYGSGWYKCSMTLDPSQMSNVGNIFISFSVGITGNETNNFDGDGTSGIYIFGAQFEQNSYPTSYIPTSGSAVTRNQETCDNSGTVNDFNSEEGVLYAEIAALANDGTSRRISLSDGSINNRVSLEIDETANKIKAFISSGGVSQILEHTATDLTQNNKIAIKYKLNDMSIWLNGSEVVTDTSGDMPIGLDRLNFDGGDSNRDFFGKTKNLQVFNYALTDEELQTLTT